MQDVRSQKFRPIAPWAAGVLTALGALVAAGGAAAQAATAPAAPAAATQHRVLFDNSKAETAGNADWIISTSQPDPLGQNPSPSAETDWTGALSSWGVALQKTGDYALKTLPSGNTITYGTSSPLDLKNFDTFVLPEPNVLLSASEKTAVMQFVKNGGGLFLISDHTGSDRNNDGADAVQVINDLMSNNSVNSNDPFGFSVDSLNIATDNPRATGDGTDPVLNGSFGKVTGSIIRNGTTATLKPADNPAAKGEVYRTGYSGNTGAFFATSTFGSGRIAFWGDSSPIDDGTGQSGNTLYDGWNDPAGTDAALALNATAWLSGAAWAVAAAPLRRRRRARAPSCSPTPASSPAVRAGRRPAASSTPAAPSPRTPARTRPGSAARAPRTPTPWRRR